MPKKTSSFAQGAYFMGVTVQSFGWAGLYLCLLLFWVLQIQIIPFRYLGF